MIHQNLIVWLNQETKRIKQEVVVHLNSVNLSYQKSQESLVYVVLSVMFLLHLVLMFMHHQ